MKPIALTLLVAATALLAGCASGPRGPGPAAITALVLEQPVTVPDGRARAFLQDGQLVKGINEFRPHCAVEIRQVSGPPRTVPAGRYPVKAVQGVLTEVVWAGPPRQVARVGFGIFIGSGGGGVGVGVNSAGVGFDGDSPSDVFEGYHFWLVDAAGVGLMRLTCFGTRAQPVDVEPPTRAEIDRALGEFGKLESGQPR